MKRSNGALGSRVPARYRARPQPAPVRPQADAAADIDAGPDHEAPPAPGHRLDPAPSPPHSNAAVNEPHVTANLSDLKFAHVAELALVRKKTASTRSPAEGRKSAMDLRIGERLRVARRNSGMTLDALSRASGVSKAMLSQVEHGKTNPTVIVLHKIAMALNISTSELIEEPERPKVFEVIRAGNPKHVLSTNQRCIGRMLSPLWAEKGLEFFELDLPPGGALNSKPHAPQTVEMLTVAKGEVEVVSHEQAITLNVGDSIAYSADVEHGIHNVGRGEATVYLVVQYAASPWMG